MAERFGAEVPVSDPFDLRALDAALADTPFAGKLHYYATIGSTNTFALQQAESDAPEASVYFADEQTAGRGRGGHSWYSAPGSGLYVSVLLRPQIAPADALWFTLAAGLAVHEAVRELTSARPDLRWPNDLLFGERKFCGILTELHTEGARVRHLIIGIGINVHQERFPDELSAAATSLFLETGRHWPRQQLLVALLRSLHSESLKLATSASAARQSLGQSLLGRLEAASTWVRGRRVTVGEGDAFTGVTAGLDERGFLLVDTTEGTKTVLSGGVRSAPTRLSSHLAQ